MSADIANDLVKLYGTASEHAVFYQYNFHKAAKIFAGLLQTESAYFQPSPAPPAPFANVVGKFAGDPDYSCAAGNEFNGCDESWAVMVQQSQNIIAASVGLYSWFSSYSQSCIDGHTCQKALLYLNANGANVRFQNLVTIGAKYMAVMNGKGITADLDKHDHQSAPDYLQVGFRSCHLNRQQQQQRTRETPEPACVPARASENIFLARGRVRRYNGPNRSPTTVVPSVAFPTPLPSIGPGAPPPPTGN
ncbi:hypothetical protein F4777DRAFT_577267 [Nemania sp. FL0916]|nr:hypothetical protein F4777DRAFT_577267 [Nemania sp. FL0916]